jgi:hypothetical protein
MPSTPLDYDEISKRLDDAWDEQDGAAFRAALHDLSLLAERGDLAAAEAFAEILAQDGPHRAPDAAYKWYFIALSQQGYSVAFRDLNKTPPKYRGPVGDFRNESVVGELVSQLGFERVAELDLEASAWLQARKLLASG